MTAWRKSTLKSLLEGCSWQYALENIYGQPSHGSPHTALGTGFHAAVELWENSDRQATMAEMQLRAEEAAFAQAKDLPMELWFEHGLDPQWVVDGAREAVRLWVEQPFVKGGLPLQAISEGRRCLGTEIRLEAEHPDTDAGITGTLDALYEEENGLVVVDYKTAGSFRKWTYDQPASIEASTYMWLVSQNYDAPQYSFEWHIVSPKQGKTRLVSAGNMTLEQLKKLSLSVKEADILTKHGAYRPNVTWNLCSSKWCPFYQGCIVTGELSPTRLPIVSAPPSETVG
jgi:hypothetical protein